MKLRMYRNMLFSVSVVPWVLWTAVAGGFVVVGAYGLNKQAELEQAQQDLDDWEARQRIIDMIDEGIIFGVKPEELKPKGVYPPEPWDGDAT